MNNIFFGYVLTSLAGLSTMIGSFIIFLKYKSDKIISCSLSFAAGVMISVSIFDLIPESFHLLTNIFRFFPSIIYILIFITSGIIFSMMIDKYIPTGNNNLYRIGIISMLAIVLHNIPEGIATFMATNADISLGMSLAGAIALHNIPEGISIAIPIYYATRSHFKALFYTFISSLSEPFGALLAHVFLMNLINDRIMGLLFSFISGIMIHIALYELIPASREYKYKLSILFFILGFILMIINKIYF